jgi:RNA polymerase sigma-70 factor, ECF subfamily
MGRCLMANLSYKGLFEGWEVAVAKKLVGEFKKQWRCLGTDDFEDLLQECLTHWLFAKDKYDPSAEASVKTFMGRVVRNKLSDIVKERGRDKRKVYQSCESLDQPLNDEEDASTLLDLLPDDEADFRLSVELGIDLPKAIRKLTPLQREICGLISEAGSNVTDISRQLGIRRKAVYREIERIRAIFENEGLKNYLD